MRCPDENVLAGYVDGGLERKQRAGLERHIDGCVVCRAIVSDLARVAHDPVSEDTMRDSSDQALAATSVAAPTQLQRLALASSGGGATFDDSSQRRRPVQLVPGTMVGEYEITGVIGAGGMGAVYSAVHPRIGKQAAVKVLQRQLAGDPAAIVRFENEAKAVNEIRHPNIVDIFAFGELPDGSPYFVMECVEGESLQAWLEKRGRLSLERAMPILSQVFDALAAAHERGIVHRDLKPGNIMIGGTDQNPLITVLDFGLAKMTRKAPGAVYDPDMELTIPGIAMGTPLFMPPEQYLGEQVDHRADIYSLAVIVYQIVTGRYPFAGATPTVVGMQHVVEAPPTPSSVIPSLSRQLDATLLKGLAKDANDRYSSVREFREALAACVVPGETDPQRVSNAPRPVVPPSGTDIVHRPRRRRAPLVIAISFAAAMAIGAVAFLAGRKQSASVPETGPTPEPSTVPLATQPAPSPEPPVAAPSAPPPQPAAAPPVVVETPAATTVTPTKVTKQPHKPKTATPTTTTTPATGSATSKPPCDPYKSLDGC